MSDQGSPPATEVTQIFTNDLLMIGRSGRLFRIHPEYVAVDNHTPLTLASKEWKQLVCDHLRWGASNIVGQMGMSPDHVVVLEYEAGETRIMSWFVRIHFETGVAGLSAGQQFLWQMPHAAVMKLSIAIVENKRIFNLESNM